MKPGVVRLALGALVAIALLSVGGSLLADDQVAGGAVVVGLGLYRAGALVREARRLRQGG